MNLTDYERRMLDGEFGAARQKAIEFIVEYGTALNAPCLIPVSSVAGGLEYSAFTRDFYEKYGMDALFSEFNLNSSEELEIPVVSVPTATTISLTDVTQSEAIGVDRGIHDFCVAGEEYSKAKGMQCLSTCVPYQSLLIPTFGEHLAWMESSAVVAANSIFGARTNTESIESSGASSLSGRTPYWGLHCLENRYATHEFQINYEIEHDRDWGLLGYLIGEIAQENIPVVTGLKHRPTFDELKHFGAASAASGGVEIYHMPGFTPEAHTLGMALGENEPQETIHISKKDIESTYMRLNSQGESSDIDYIVLGCPHYSLNQIKELVRLLNGRAISASLEMWVYVPYTTKSMCDRQGYSQELKKAGVRLLADTCAVVGNLAPTNARKAATNSAKMAHYLPSVVDVQCFFGATEDCVEAAISGKWEGVF